MITAPRRAQARARHGGRTRGGLVAAAALIALTGLALTGCSTGASGPEHTGRTDTGAARPGGSTAPPAPATAAPTPPATPVSLPCSALITDAQLHAYNPDVSALPGSTPSSSLVRQAAAQKGRACGWLDRGGRDRIEFGVAHPAASVLTDLKDDAAASSTATPAYGNYPAVEGYFSRVGGVGTAEVFAGGYWIVGTSPVFLEPGDAAQLVQDVMGNLRVG